MKRIFIFIVALVMANFFILTISIGSASAHGVGGIEPSETKTNILSVIPASDLFRAESIENGDRFKITRTSDADVTVLGVDDEPYILLNDKGTFVNMKSATRLINKSTDVNYSKTISKEDFEKTSADPNQVPDWDQVNSSQSYAWHDHRTHYMGTVPSGIANLGSSTLKVKANNITHVITVEFLAKNSSQKFILPVVLFALLIALGLFAFFKKESFSNIMNRKFVIGLLFTLCALETIHIWGYIAFSQNNLWQEITSTMFSISLVSIAFITAIRLLNIHEKNQNWKLDLSRHAPLISLTGFLGIFVGAIFEYKTFTYPYLPTIIAPGIVIAMVSVIAIISFLLLILGISNIKNVSHNEELILDSQD
jgi:hypothetical protein